MTDATMDRKMLRYGGNPRAIFDEVVWPADENNDRQNYDSDSSYTEDLVSEKISDRVDVPARPTPMYSKGMLVAFCGSGAVVVIAVIALIISPLYASRNMVAVLFLVCAMGVGALSLVLERAEKVAAS